MILNKQDKCMKLNCHCGMVEAEINASINELEKIQRYFIHKG